jgi:hypothetical protein
VEELGRYFDCLLVWAGVLRHTPEQCLASENSVLKLAEEDRYPTLERLKEVIKRHGITEYTSVDLSNAIRVLGETRPYLEDATSIRSLTLADGATCTPIGLLARLGSDIGNSFKEALFIPLVAEIEGYHGSIIYIATRSLPERSVEELESPTEELSISGVVELVETLDGELIEKNMAYAMKYILILHPPQVDANLGIEHLYKDPVLAARFAYDNLLSQTERSKTDLGRIIYSSHFVDTIEQLGIHRQQSVLRRTFWLAALAGCGRIFDVRGTHIHPVRTSIAAEAAQVERADGAKYWRCTITTKGAGYRLQYWSLLDGGIELDCVTNESTV